MAHVKRTLAKFSNWESESPKLLVSFAYSFNLSSENDIYFDGKFEYDKWI